MHNMLTEHCSAHHRAHLTCSCTLLSYMFMSQETTQCYAKLAGSHITVRNLQLSRQAPRQCARSHACNPSTLALHIAQQLAWSARRGGSLARVRSRSAVIGHHGAQAKCGQQPACFTLSRKHTRRTCALGPLGCHMRTSQSLSCFATVKPHPQHLHGLDEFQQTRHSPIDLSLFRQILSVAMRRRARGMGSPRAPRGAGAPRSMRRARCQRTAGAWPRRRTARAAAPRRRPRRRGRPGQGRGARSAQRAQPARPSRRRPRPRGSRCRSRGTAGRCPRPCAAR